MTSKERGKSELHPRYHRIIRSMLISNFVLNINDRINNSAEPEFDDILESMDDVNDVSLIRYCG